MEGYVKTDVGGKSYGYKFDIKSLGFILKDLDCPLADIGKAIGNPFHAWPIILYNGAKRAVEKSGKVVNFTQDDFYELIEKEDGNVLSENVSKIIGVFTDSMTELLPKSGKEKKEQASPNGRKK